MGDNAGIEMAELNAHRDELSLRDRVYEGIPVFAAEGFVEAARRFKLYMQLVVYLIFIVFLFSMVFYQRNVQVQFSQNAAIKDTVFGEELDYADDDGNVDNPFPKTFFDIGEVGEFWSFVQGPLLGSVYEAYEPGIGAEPVSEFSIKGYNSVIFGVEFRQMRVKKYPLNATECQEEFSFEEDLGISFCYPEYSCETKDTEPFTRNNHTYGYREDTSRMDSILFTVPLGCTSEVAGYYGRGGHTFLLPLSHPDPASVVDQLIEDEWIDSATRAVSITMNLWNPNTKVLLVSRAMYESFATGMLRVHAYHFPIQDSYPRETTFTALMIIITAFFLYFCLAEFQAIAQSKPMVSYFSSLWNWVQLIQLAVLALVLADWGLSILNDEKFDFATDHYEDAYDDGYSYYYTGMMISWLALLSFINVFKYLQLSAGLMSLWLTIGAALQDIAVFTVILGIITVGFGIQANLAFGFDLEEYRSIAESISSLMLILLGDFDYNAMREVRPLFAPIFFTLWTVGVFMILLNMFIAIVSDAYAEVQEERKSAESLQSRPVNPKRMLIVWVSKAKRLLPGKHQVEVIPDDEAVWPRTANEIAVLASHIREKCVSLWGKADRQVRSRGSLDLLTVLRNFKRAGQKKLTMQEVLELGIKEHLLAKILKHMQMLSRADELTWQYELNEKRRRNTDNEDDEEDADLLNASESRVHVVDEDALAAEWKADLDARLDSIARAQENLVVALMVLKEKHIEKKNKLSETVEMSHSLKDALAKQKEEEEEAKRKEFYELTNPSVPQQTYTVEVKTGDVSDSTTTAGVYVRFLGENGVSDEVQLDAAKCTGGITNKLFHRSATSTFTFVGKDVGFIDEVQVRHDNRGLGPGWYLDFITVREGDVNGRKWMFPCSAWLAVDEGDGHIQRSLYNASADVERADDDVPTRPLITSKQK
eukprot:Rmarinus@m.13808